MGSPKVFFVVSGVNIKTYRGRERPKKPLVRNLFFPWIERRKEAGRTRGERKDGEKGAGLKYYLQGSHVTTSDHLRHYHTSRDSALGSG